MLTFLIFAATSAFAASSCDLVSPTKQEDRIQCWKKARGMDNRAAAIVCSSADPAAASSCWHNAYGVSTLYAAILCATQDSDQAIKCWRGASGVDDMSAAILCTSKSTDQAFRCWKNARGVDNTSAAILCSDSLSVPVYAAIKEYEDEKELARQQQQRQLEQLNSTTAK